jgi:hypothetical protein
LIEDREPPVGKKILRTPRILGNLLCLSSL